MNLSGRTAQRSFVFFAAGIAAFSVLAVSGCGGSGGSTPPGTTSRSKVPTSTTKSRVATLHNAAFRWMGQNGYATPSVAYALNSGFAAGAPTASPGSEAGGAGSASGVADSSAHVPAPLLGAFLRNVAATSRVTRAVHVNKISRARDEAPGDTSNTTDDSSIYETTIAVGEPTPGGPATPASPAFYYDYYLGLWVSISDTDSTSTYTLFEDEAKTKPAGSIITTQPTDYSVFPQTYESTYNFTAGFLAGSHGQSTNINKEDGSGTSSYVNVYVDGWKDSGNSSWSGQGDYSWASRTETASGQWTTGRGGFRADGGGGTHMETSDGYKSDYVYNSDGSGHGTITGSDPGLPVTISWDVYGTTTIRYADGSIETIPGWNSATPVTGDGSNGGTTSVPPTEPVAVSTKPL